MKRSESFIKIAAAMGGFQAAIKPIEKNAVNPHFGKKYADLAAIYDAIREPLQKNGLVIFQDATTTDGSKVKITTLLTHTSGEFIENELDLIAAAATPQGIGSAITYGRRYSLSTILGIAAEDDDDDGNAGTQAPKSQAPTAKPAAAKPAQNGKSAPTNTPAPAGSTATAKPGAEKAAQPLTDRQKATLPGGTAKAPEETKGDGKEHRTPAQMRSDLAKLCLEMATMDPTEAVKILEGLTRWEKIETDENGNETKKVFPGKRATADISDKALPVVLRRATEMHKKHFAPEGPTAEQDGEGGDIGPDEAGI